MNRVHAVSFNGLVGDRERPLSLVSGPIRAEWSFEPVRHGRCFTAPFYWDVEDRRAAALGSFSRLRRPLVAAMKRGRDRVGFDVSVLAIMRTKPCLCRSSGKLG